MVADTDRAGGAFTIGVKKSILGAKVINAHREDMGKIEDIVLDAKQNRVAYAIVSLGGFLGFGDEHFPVPWEALSFDLSEKAAVLGVDKERLKSAPRFHKDKWPDMTDAAWGESLHRHYGYEPYWKRKASTRRKGSSR
jgi:PRC-barrel domain